MSFLRKKLKEYRSLKGTIDREEYAISIVIFFSLVYNFFNIVDLILYEIFFFIADLFITFPWEGAYMSEDELESLLRNMDEAWEMVWAFSGIPLFLFPVLYMISISIQRARDIGWHFVVGILASASLLCNTFFGPLVGLHSPFFNLLLLFLIPLFMVESSENK